MKKKLVIVLTCMALAVSGCASSSEDSEITVGENQELVYAVVTSITGNEITYMEVEESQVEELLGTDESDSTDNSSDKSAQDKSDSDSTDSDSTDSTDTKSADSSQGGMPTDGNMPSGDMPTDGNMPSGDMPSQGDSTSTDTASMGEMPQMDSTEMPSEGKNATASLSGTTVTTMIPVSSTVHTTADTTTTFSRIASGDVLKMLVEPDEDGNQVILEIWMVM